MTQPEALRLADSMIDYIDGPSFHVPHYEVREAAAELRRLHEENERLRQALLQPEQKPVAIVNEGMDGIEWLDKPLPDDTPLYTAPTKREWVGLTDAEVEAWRGNYDFFDSALVKEVEAKLKEKNT